jgi:predicted ATPase/DNA-binding winged helix-turn-helix (wHTH) protein
MADQSAEAVYESNGWEIDLSRRELRSRGTSVPIGSRAFEILEALVRSGGELVNKHHLMHHIWPGAIVEENTLQFHISAIRKALGADRDLLKTVSGRGYRLLGTWAVRQPTEPERRVDFSERKPERPFRTNVPIAGSALIGRGAPRQHLLNVLSAYRVITLTGPGGIGKSVLALEVARGLFPTFAGDCWLVELASLSDPALVPSAVASVLGLRIGGNEISAESVARAVGREKLMLVLDNCEHLADAVAGLAEAMVRMCPNLSVLATSREILRIEGEYVYRLPPLDVPPQPRDDLARIDEYSAVQLFTARLAAVDSGFSTRPDNLPLIAAVCRQLDGIPLAIEFAAARAATLGLQQVADRLNDRFGLLTSGRRTALPRHQTLRATLDWSYDLLPPSEQAILNRLAIFAGAFTLDSATAVVVNDEVTAAQAIDGIANLFTSSLIAVDIGNPGAHYRLLETTRAYSLDKLAQSGEFERLERRHAEHFRDIFERAEPEWETGPTEEWLAIYGGHVDNVRAALAWAFSPRGDVALGLALTVAAVPLWFQLSLIDECRGSVERALAVLSEQKQDDRRKMQLFAALGWSKMYSPGAARETGAAWATTLELANALDDSDYKLRAIWGLWAGTQDNGECRAALELAEKFRKLAADSPNASDPLVGDRMMGLGLHFLGQQADARQLIEHMLGRYVSPNRSSHIIRFKFDQQVMARNTLARILWLQGFADRAMQEVENNIEHALSIDHVHSLCNVLTQAAAQVAILVGNLAAAERLNSMLLHLIDRHGLYYWRAHYDGLNGQLLIKRGDLDAGLSFCRAGVEGLRRSRSLQHFTTFLAALAEGLADAGKVAEGFAVIDEALARCERYDERWCFAELLRIRAKLILLNSAPDGTQAAEDHLLRSLGWARQQGALSWELRTATSLARLWRDSGQTAQARDMLGGVYGRFTEGFATRDLAEARTLLDAFD